MRARALLYTSVARFREEILMGVQGHLVKRPLESADHPTTVIRPKRFGTDGPRDEGAAGKRIAWVLDATDDVKSAQ